jgi:hypothetical protein
MFMWRVVLSVLAAVFDGLMLLLMGLAVPRLINPPAYRIAPNPAVMSASVQNNAHVAGLWVAGFIVGGMCLNLLAIAFGARLRLRRAPTRAAVAAEFA